MRLLKPFVPNQEYVPATQSVEEAVESDDDVIAKKEQFAELFLRNPNAFEVALLIYSDTGKALRIANDWPNDPQVKILMESLKDAAEEFAFHPTKEQFARSLLKNAEELLSRDAMTAHKYHDSYRRMRWPDKAVEINDNRIVNNVMVVRDHGNEEEFEKKALAQQRQLKAESVVSTIERTTDSD